MDYKKIVLAYSGGLDTSIIITWLKENYNNCEVIAVTGNVGQGDYELEGLEEKAKKTGASKLYILDLKEEMVNDYVAPAIKAGATYEGDYLLGTPFTRPLLAKKLVEIAKKEGADAVCHGCTGKGNDQVRFELAVKALAPDMPVIAPWRIWDIKGREDAIDYAEKHNIPLKISRETNYSKDKNLWHLSHEGLDLEDISNVPPKKAKDEETIIELEFEKGLPVALNGEKLGLVEIIEKLNKIGGENGIGILDKVENRLVGMKSRGVYETPGGTIIYKAHSLLESICLDKDTMHFKQIIANKLGEILYDAKWYTTLREAICAFVDKTQETVTGKVSLKLYKGNIIPNGLESKYSLYSVKTASFNEDNEYNQKDAKGYINLYGLPIKIKARMEGK